jgi:lysophospholipase L1-like esterase
MDLEERQMVKVRWTGYLVLAFVLSGCATFDKGFDAAQYDHTIRVACVGDSITFGAGIENRDENSYPAQLGKMLGEGWDVRNFGVSGATLLRKGDLPYWEVDSFRAARAYEPDVVVIKLGTNDTKPQNWKYADEFVSDYVDLIEEFQNLPSHPWVWICYPAPVYETRWGIREEIVVNEVKPKIDEIARRTGVPVIDLYSALSGMPEVFPDSIHPNAEGAEIMATVIAETLSPKK